jgi:N-acetylmuramoyl-L-alanine amidase
MIEITQDLIHINPFSRDGTKLRAKRGIVMHYTATPGAPAKNISHYFDGLKDQNPNDDVKDRYAGAHFSVDRFTIFQSIPTDEQGYQCGSSQPYTIEALTMLGTYPNNSTVGIEMCIEVDGSIHKDTFQNAADLVLWLIRDDGFPNVIFTHKGVVGWKDCPLPWVKNPAEFERFKNTVNVKLEELRMLDELLARLVALEKECEKTTAPEWFVNEFKSADLGGLIRNPCKSNEFWESVAVILRAIKYVPVA